MKKPLVNICRSSFIQTDIPELCFGLRYQNLENVSACQRYLDNYVKDFCSWVTASRSHSLLFSNQIAGWRLTGADCLLLMVSADVGCQPIMLLSYFRIRMPYREQGLCDWQGEAMTPCLTGFCRPCSSDGSLYANERGLPMPNRKTAGFSCPQGF